MKPDDVTDGVALDCSCLRPNGSYLEAYKLDEFTSKAKVFARAKPEDKLVIVKSLQDQGLVCAMTGDGVNDAPALKQSDIGVAMGIQGTDVAKSASDMILVDDNFVSIVGAVERGRTIYAGIQKFVAFIMSVHIGEVLQIFSCIVINTQLIRSPLQILFLILVTDLPPAVALGQEPGDPDIMLHRPRPKSQPIVIKWMWLSIWANGLILASVIFVCFLICLDHYAGMLNNTDITERGRRERDSPSECTIDDGQFCMCRYNDGVNFKTIEECNKNFEEFSMSYRIRQAQTAAFIAVVFAENLRAYSSRSFDTPCYIGLLTNPSMQKAVFIAQTALWIVVLTPYLSTDIFGLDGTSVDGFGFFMAVGSAFVCLLICELYKFVAATHIRAYRKKETEEAQEGERLRLENVLKEHARNSANISSKQLIIEAPSDTLNKDEVAQEVADTIERFSAMPSAVKSQNLAISSVTNGVIAQKTTSKEAGAAVEIEMAQVEVTLEETAQEPPTAEEEKEKE